MNPPSPIARHPVAWLRPLPGDFKIPLWRWIILPASTWMLWRHQGIWVNGDLTLTPENLQFTETKSVKLSRHAPTVWTLPLTSISDVSVRKGMALETLEIHRGSETVKLTTMRSAEFIAPLNAAIREATTNPNETG